MAYSCDGNDLMVSGVESSADMGDQAVTADNCAGGQEPAGESALAGPRVGRPQCALQVHQPQPGRSPHSDRRPSLQK